MVGADGWGGWLGRALVAALYLKKSIKNLGEGRTENGKRRMETGKMFI